MWSVHTNSKAKLITQKHNEIMYDRKINTYTIRTLCLVLVDEYQTN